METPVLNREPFNIGAMHHAARADFDKLITAARAFWFECRVGPKCRFEPFEGYRHPMRQLYLVEETKNTKARPWQSAHQYGLALDFAVRRYDEHMIANGWSWPNDAPWERLRDIARTFELDIPLAWDRGHVQHPLWTKIRKLF